MRRRALMPPPLVFLLFAALGVAAQLSGHRDVCVMGAGASGMSSAVFLKDLGYSVVVLEKNDVVGGHCQTIPLSVPANCSTCANWLDIGVQQFPDTLGIQQQANSFPLNLAQYGPWSVSSTAFGARFAGEAALSFPPPVIPGSGPANFMLDIANSTLMSTECVPGCPSIPPADFNNAFATALATYLSILANYPWMDAEDFPDVVDDPILLMSVSEFVTRFNLCALMPVFFGAGEPAGMGDFNSLLTVYFMRYFSPSMVAQTFGLVNNSYYAVNGGCIQIYNGIVKYLGPENVITSATTTLAVRDGNAANIALTGTVSPPGGAASPFSFTCDNLIIAFTPEASSLASFMSLDQQEEAVFSQVLVRPYFVSVVDFGGGTEANTSIAFSVTNINCTQPFGEPPFPAVESVLHVQPYGSLATVYSVDEGGRMISDAQMLGITQQQMKNVAVTLDWTHCNVTQFYRHEGYSPFVSADALRQGFFGQAKQLQGHRHTFYVSTLFRSAGTYLMWDYSAKLIQQNFQQKGGSGVSVKVIVGVTVGVGGFLVLALIVCLCRRRKQSRQSYVMLN